MLPALTQINSTIFQLGVCGEWNRNMTRVSSFNTLPVLVFFSTSSLTYYLSNTITASLTPYLLQAGFMLFSRGLEAQRTWEGLQKREVIVNPSLRIAMRTIKMLALYYFVGVLQTNFLALASELDFVVRAALSIGKTRVARDAEQEETFSFSIGYSLKSSMCVAVACSIVAISVFRSTTVDFHSFVSFAVISLLVGEFERGTSSLRTMEYYRLDDRDIPPRELTPRELTLV